MINLPQDFVNRINSQLLDKASSFLDAYSNCAYKGLRINTLKKNREKEDVTSDLLPFRLSPIEWAPGGYYYDDTDEPGKHPYHEAGLYYIQEPSAMSPVPLLEINPGETILDLCASPGGKSTQIASYMQGKGLLVANEIHPQRAKILSENIERIGVENAIVTNEAPERLSPYFEGFFDKILVDAPCSGEGMFRKNPETISEWSLDNVKLCAERQDFILDHAYLMLRNGGRMVYSTCTFAPEEDEECMARFIQRHPDMVMLSSHRFWPHIHKGEGHFAAVLTKGSETPYVSVGRISLNKVLSDKDLKDYLDFLKDSFEDYSKLIGNIIAFGDQLYLLPQGVISLNKLKVVRPGLHLGTMKKNRFEPSHALALCSESVNSKYYLSLSSDDPLIKAYLNGQSFPYDGPKGWYIICVDGYSIGWGKCAGGIMKNHYPKGLRIN